MNRFLSLSVAGLALCFVACHKSRKAPAPIPGAAELEVAVQNAGIQAQPSKPVVSDELFALGQALFFDKILSGNNDVSCATCHWPELATGDERTLPGGVGGTGLGNQRFNGAIVPRNSPTVLNVHRLTEFFWDGRIERNGSDLVTPGGAAVTPQMRAIFDQRWQLVAAQALFPPTSRDEMRGANGSNAIANLADSDLAGIWNALRDRMVAFTEYQQLFMAAYPALTSIADIDFAHAANAIAAFEVRAFTRNDSPFERFVQGDARAMTAAQVAGGLEFFGAGNCMQCHSGSLFSDQKFHNTCLPQLGPGKGDGVGGLDDFGRERVSGMPADRYRFRTPSLLNVGLTAPYGHAGQYATLTEIVRHYLDPAMSLQNYDIFMNVSDPALTGTLVPNQSDIIASVSPMVQAGRMFDVDAVVTFLAALTADSAVDMSALIPASVPSGLPLR